MVNVWKKFRERLIERGEEGFTLVELMVVVAIIGILAAVLVPNVMGRVDTAENTACQASQQTIEHAARMYSLENEVEDISSITLEDLEGEFIEEGSIPEHWEIDSGDTGIFEEVHNSIRLKDNGEVLDCIESDNGEHQYYRN